MSKIQKSELENTVNELEKATETLSKAQLFHTPSDSNPDTWAGSTQETVGDMVEDFVVDGGANLNTVKQYLNGKVEKGMPLTAAEVLILKGENPGPTISAKISKRGQLTPAELWVVQKGWAGMSKATSEQVAPTKLPASNPGAAVTDKEPEVPLHKADEDKDDGDKDDDDMMMGKSLNVLNENLIKGFNALFGAIEEVVKGLNDLKGKAETTEKFNKSLGNTVVKLAKSVNQTTEVVKSMPVRGPRGLAPTQGVLEKSFGAGNTSPLANISKAQVADTLFDMYKSNLVSEHDVVRFDAEGKLTPEVQKSLEKFLGRKE